MRFRILIASLATFAGVTVLQAAETVYKTAWVQNFEDAEKYAAEARPGWYARTNDLEIVQGSTTPINQAERTMPDGTTSKFLRISRSGKNTKTSLIYDFPYIVSASTVENYRLSWWQFLGHGFANNNPPYSYFQIVGNKGLLAVVELGYVYNSNDTTVQIWNAAGESLGSIVVAGRDTDPVTNLNWNQFVVTCDENGVRLDVFNRAGTKVVDGAVLSASIDQVKLLSHELCMGGNYYSITAGLDDVVVELPASGETFTWTGAAGDGLWATAGNWLVDGNVALSAPTELDAVVIPDGAMVVVSPDITYKTVTLGAGAKLCVLVGAIGETFAIPAGLEAADIVVAGPFVMAANEGMLTVSERLPSTFVWSAGETGAWSMSSSWSVNGLPTLVAPIKGDTVRFEDDATVDFTANAGALSLEIAPGKTVTGNGNGKTLSGLRYFGTAEEKGGKLVLNKLNIESYSMNDTIAEPVTVCNWYGDLEIAGDGYTNTIYCMSTDNKSATKRLNLFGNLSGTGTVCLMGEGHHGGGTFDGRASVSLYGNNAAFTGVGIVKNNSAAGRSYATFCSATASGAAIWALEKCLYLYDRNNLAGTIDASIADSVIAFGAIEGQTVLSAGGTTMAVKVVEIGGANTDFETWLSFNSTTAGVRPGNYATLKKVGTGMMTFGGGTTYPCWTTNVLAGGVWKMNDPLSLVTPSNNQGGRVDTTIVFEGGTAAFGEAFVDESGDVLDISKNVKNSTAPISVLVDGEQNVVWTNALAASNVGGLVKKGAGTLTLKARPAYTGATRIEGGKLVVEDAINLGETGSTVVVDDPAAAFAAGTVYLEATQIIGKATIDTDVDPAIAREYRLTKKKIDGMSCLCVDKVGGVAIIIK